MVTDNRARQVVLKTPQQIDAMRPAGRMVGETLAELRDMTRVGMALAELDRYVLDKFERLAVTPTFLGYQGFPHTICASINEQIVHGFATDRRLEDGDILSVDLGATIDGWVGDAAITYGVGTISAIGPTRMAYPRTIACVRFISALMTDTLARVHG